MNFFLRRKKIIILAIFFVFLGLEILITTNVASWFYAINTSVRLSLEASAENEIDICWDEQQLECLPLIPYKESLNDQSNSFEIVNLWLGELPPRPTYYISLVFKNGIENAIFHDFEIDSSGLQIVGILPEAGINKLNLGIQEFDMQEVTKESNEDGYKISGNKNAQLILNYEIRPGPLKGNNRQIAIKKIWILLTLLILIILVPISVLPKLILNRSDGIKNIKTRKYPLWFFIFCLIIFGLLIYFIVNSAVLLNFADPIGYLWLAKGGGWFNESRMPGYPLFLYLSLLLSNNKINGVILIQAILLGMSVISCVWLLRKWMHPLAASLFVLFSILSPVQVHFTRWVLRETLFSSLVLFGVTLIIVHFSKKEPGSSIVLIIFAIISAYAFLVRENGLLLPLTLIPILVLEIIKKLRIVNNRKNLFNSIFSLIAYYSIPFVAIGLVYIGFASYNFINFGFFQTVEPQTSHHFLAKTLFTSNFDSRSLLKPMTKINSDAEEFLGIPIYSSFIISRYQNPGFDPIYSSFYIFLDNEMGEEQQSNGNKFYQASILEEIGRNSYSLLPWQANFAGLLRHFNAFIFANNSTFSYEPDDFETIKNKRKWLGWVSPELEYEGRFNQPDSVVANYYNFTYKYKFFSILMILAFISGGYILVFKDPVFLSPLIFFLINCGVLMITRYVDTRYFAILDVLLILQITLGLSFWLNDNFEKKIFKNLVGKIKVKVSSKEKFD